MFGFEPRVGLSTTGLPSHVISKILDENDLSKVFNSIREGPALINVDQQIDSGTVS